MSTILMHVSFSSVSLLIQTKFCHPLILGLYCYYLQSHSSKVASVLIHYTPLVNLLNIFVMLLLFPTL